MKKLFTLATLLLFAAAWTTMSARWVVGERKSASQIMPGDTVVVKYAGSGSASDFAEHYLQAAEGEQEALGVIVAPGLGLGAAAVIAVEEGPEDIRTGAPTVMLKLVGSQKYIAGKCYDWYDKGQNVTTSPDNAGYFQIISCGEEIPWYDETRTDGFTKWDKAETATWDEKSVGFAISPSTTDFCYLSYWGSYQKSAPRAITWKYTNSAQWDVYSVAYEKDYREDLEALINSYSNASSEFTGGTNPGFYDEEIISAYTETLGRALAICYDQSTTDQQIMDVYKELQDAYKAMANSLIPVTEGYYYIVCDNENIANTGSTEKAMYINADAKQVYWGEFNPEDLKFVFHLTPHDATQWDVKNLMTDLYLGAPAGFCKPFASCEDNSYPATFYYYVGTGSCYMKTDNWTLCPHGNASGSVAGPDYVWAYNGETVANGNRPHHEWTWTLRKVTDQAVLDRFFNAKEQADRTAVLKQLTSEAEGLYDKLFVYDIKDQEGLITNPEAQVQFSTIRKQGVSWADKYEFLTDGNPTTYMQGAGFIQIDLSATPQEKVVFFYDKRAATDAYPNAGVWGEDERPADITVLATNDVENEESWTEISNIKMGDLAAPILKGVDLGAEYKYLRYKVNLNKTLGSYFTISEFQVYPAVVDQVNSQYYTAEGIQPVADSLKNLIKAQAEIIANNAVTEADIVTLQEQIAAVKSFYADTTVLAEIINNCYELVATTTAGTEVGQIDDASLIDDLVMAIFEAEDQGFKPGISKSELDAVLNNLTTVRDNFLAHIKSFEAGKWYYIINNDATEESAVASNALYMTGCNDSNAAGVGLINEDGSPAYTYDPYAMWTFVPTENGGYNIQNLGTGFYLGGFVKKSEPVLLSYKGEEYKINFLGAGSYSLIPQTVTNIAKYAVTASEGKTVFDVAASETPSSWKIIEINPEELEVITVSDFDMNCIDVIALPYEINNIAEYNDDVHIYGIKKITQDEEGVSTVELYEKTSAAAGESCIIVLGNPEADSESTDLLLPFPTSVTSKATPVNGIYGMLHNEKIGEGEVYSTGSAFVAATGETTITGHTGAIIPSLYTGEVTGVETALTLTITGMNKIPEDDKKFGDVNGDGKVNSTDVVAIYNYIQTQGGVNLESADVNGDGNVNSTDIVAVYNTIAGSGAKCRGLEKMISRLLGE